MQAIAADLRRLVAIVPFRSLEGGKSRLGGSLDAEERTALGGRLLERTVQAAADVPAIGSVVVVSPDPAVLRIASALGATPVRQSDEGLNEGLRTAARWAIADGASAILVLAADLPAADEGSIRTVVEVAGAASEPGRGLVAMVPDRRREGTNVLLLSPPDVIAFAFGPGSRAAHRAAAEAVGAVLVEVDGPLMFDLDLPEDLIQAEELGLLDPARGG
jgi:2-phospho-L-lactate guanylyltransferase